MRKQFPLEQIWMVQDDFKNDCKIFIKFVKKNLYGVDDVLIATGGQRPSGPLPLVSKGTPATRPPPLMFRKCNFADDPYS
jgi:hypothetical protein